MTYKVGEQVKVSHRGVTYDGEIVELPPVVGTKTYAVRLWTVHRRVVFVLPENIWQPEA